jgi:ABC-type glycerol-3-phosphate transport system substrate-binding protein
MTLRKFLALIVLSSFTAAALPACNTRTTGTDPAKQEGTLIDKKEPFTLFISANSGLLPEEFDSMFKSRISKKYPFITIKYQMKEKNATIQDLVAAGTIPDIIRTDIPSLKADYIDINLGFDMRDLVKKYNYDLKRFTPSFTQEIIDAGQTGALYGLPVPPFYPQVLYYNKDLFDRFGVPYPKDGMNWDEVYEIARKMTRSDGGETYRGFSANLQAGLRDNSFSLPILDPTGDQLADNEKWQALFKNYARFYQLSGNTIAKDVSSESKAFNEGKTAMMLSQYHTRTYPPDTFRWDYVSIPILSGAPKVVTQRGPAYWSITNTSKLKDEAFQVIMELLSDEAQTDYIKDGNTTTLLKADIRKELGKNHPAHKTKNNSAVYYYEPSAPTPKRKSGLVDVPGRDQEIIITDAFFEVVTGKADLNTALRKADERLKMVIQQEKAKAK